MGNKVQFDPAEEGLLSQNSDIKGRIRKVTNTYIRSLCSFVDQK